MAPGRARAQDDAEFDVIDDVAEPPEVLERPVRKGPKFRVTINSEPPGATIYLDGREFGEVGQTPHDMRLPAGEYLLELELDGYETLETTIVVARKRRKRQRFTEELVEKMLGMITVEAPAGLADSDQAEVIIDGETVGTAPIDFEVELGPHQVEVRLGDDSAFEEWVDVTIDEPVVVTPAFDIDSEPEPESEPPASDPPAVERIANRVGSALLIADVGVEFGGRYFRYGGEQTDNLRPYDAFGIPMLRVGAELYPMAGSTGEWLRKLGLAGRFVVAPALESSIDGGMEVLDTSWLRFSAGARLRHESGAVLYGAGIGYSVESFDFEEGSSIESEVPDVSYRAVYLDGDIRYSGGAFAVLAGLRVLPVLSAGDTADRFRDSSVLGIGGRLGAAYNVYGGVEVRGELSYRGFFYSLEANEGDAFIADSAVDNFLGFTVNATYAY